MIVVSLDQNSVPCTDTVFSFDEFGIPCLDTGSGLIYPFFISPFDF